MSNKKTNTIATLSHDEAQAVLAIRDGADVYSRAIAGALRGIQRRGLPVTQQQGPKRTWRKPRGSLFCITAPQAYDGDGTDQMPYFGAIATDRGIQVAESVLDEVAA